MIVVSLIVLFFHLFILLWEKWDVIVVCSMSLFFNIIVVVSSMVFFLMLFNLFIYYFIFIFNMIEVR